MDIEIRNATVEDVKLVTWIVFAALDIYGEESSKMSQICSEQGTLYSWENTRIVLVDGKPAGGLIAYDGERYPQMRENTWPRCWDEPKDVLDAVGQECFPGEFYLDSMALLPEYRGLGLGKELVLDALKIAKEKGCKCATLLADKNKSGLVAYYEKIGFQKYDSMWYFDHDYWKMRVSFI